MEAPTETFIFGKLETFDYSQIYNLYSTYLQPITDLTHTQNTIPKSKPSKKSSKSQPQIRPLAKKYIAFISKSLNLLSKLLTKKPESRTSLVDLFDVYRLCLDCLQFISPELASPIYSVYIQRVRMIHCMEACELYEDAENEGFRVLEGLRGLELRIGKLEKNDRLVPELRTEGCGNAELGLVVVEVVVSMVRCVGMRQVKNDCVYRRVVALVEEVLPWFKVLDSNSNEKLRRMLVSHLNKCTLFMVGELTSFDVNLIVTFSAMTLTECTKSSIKGQVQKFACRLCSSVFLQQEGRPAVVVEILISVLVFLAGECKVDLIDSVEDFFEITYYCAKKCRNASQSLCFSIAEHFNKLAGDYFQETPFHLILRLYGAGLYFAKCNLQSRDDHSTMLTCTKDGNKLTSLLDGNNGMQAIPGLLTSMRVYFGNKSKDRRVYFCARCRNLIGGKGPGTDCVTCQNNKVPLLHYLEALNFLCQPLSDLVNSEKDLILDEDKGIPLKLFDIQEVFLEFIDVLTFCQSCFSERENVHFDESYMMAPSVALAAFTFSFRTKDAMQKSSKFIKHIISNGQLQRQGLRMLSSSLYKIGVILYRKGQVGEASRALKLCHIASWAHVLILCQKPEGPDDSLSEDVILDLVSEACTKSAFLVDILHQCGSNKINRIIVDSLEKWSAARDLCSRVPNPVPLVKQWAKVQCKLSKDVDVENISTTLYHLLSSSRSMPIKNVGIILEQELLAYEELNARNPNFFGPQMQLIIINTLLENIIGNDTLKKSRLLVMKGKVLRFRGTEGLEDCLQSLSEAISCINESYSEKCRYSSPIGHQLATAHCLRALCVQEFNPMSKQIFEDMEAALNLLASSVLRDQSSAADQCESVPEITLSLVYHVLDLMSVKGHTKLHCDIYRLMIKFFKWKSISLEKAIARLWESRRLSHPFCTSPIDQEFITELSRHYGEVAKSVDFWISCLRDPISLLISFKQTFSYLPPIFAHSSYHPASSLLPFITAGEVKGTASGLISRVPPCTRSLYLAGYLYYDLSERLLSNGQLVEALSIAKAAHHFRGKLLREKFAYSFGKQRGGYNETEESLGQCSYNFSNFQLLTSVAGQAWCPDSTSGDMDECFLTPWIILRCFLESTLQVGIIHEEVGNGLEAEMHLLWGRTVSCLHGLPHFKASFSLVLGRIYRKKAQWDLAEKELQCAKQIMVDSCVGFYCLKCKLTIDVTISQELADLYRNQCKSFIRSYPLEGLSQAENLCKSALENLNLLEWKKCFIPAKDRTVDSTTLSSAIAKGSENGAKNTNNNFEANALLPNVGGLEKIQDKKLGKTRKTSKPLRLSQFTKEDGNLRITRSRSCATQNKSLGTIIEVQNGRANYIESDNMLVGLGAPCHTESLKGNDSIAGIESEMTCSMINLIDMKWEFIRSRLSLRLLSSLGKCLAFNHQIHETHQVFWKSMSLIVVRNPFVDTRPPDTLTYLLDSIGKEIPGDVFALERATLIYEICCCLLMIYQPNNSRTSCCSLSKIQMSTIISWLLLAFVLCRQVPTLFRKVSRLLAAVYVISASKEAFVSSFPSCNAFSKSHWASYFHQASVGTHLNHQLLSTAVAGLQNSLHFEGLHVSGSTETGTKSCDIFRVVPESVQELDRVIENFFHGLPCATVICISMLGGALGSMLRNLLSYPSSVQAWVLLSRLNSRSQPVVVLLPVDSVLEGCVALRPRKMVFSAPEDSDDECTDSTHLLNDKEKWDCPWGSTIVDGVAPLFKRILEENYSTSSVSPLEDTQKNRLSWWRERKKLDQHLGEFLRDMENSWLGPWKYLLLGEWLDYKFAGSIEMKLMKDLKCKCEVVANESLLKVVLGGARYAYEQGDSLPPLLDKGCYVGSLGFHKGESSDTSNVDDNGVNSSSMLAFQLIRDAANKIEQDTCREKEPVILVLDSEVQMLPWESLPLLRNQEVYRMPSVGSIILTLDRRCKHQERDPDAVFPLIDPLDAFYLLNPSGDLHNTQLEFEDWFRERKFEGKAGVAPTIDELALALKSRDLFIYLGHGSGAQYIPGHEIQKLENCAATLLMGCSSGSIFLNGSYTPRGTPLSYLLAGSPVIVANLWEVTDKDIDRFGKALLGAFLKERSSLAASTHKPKIGSLIGQAREACTLPFLIGAAPVCYGVPTGITKKKDP